MKETILQKVVRILNSTISLGKVYNIPFLLHWSIIPFFIAIPFIAYNFRMSISESLLLLFLVFLIFISVVLHELGHAGAAKLQGIKTHDILLSLIGGAARLEKMPEEPIKEFKIAIAGPLVNLLIFSIVALPLVVLSILGIINIEIPLQGIENPVSFVAYFALSNFFLFLFNLVPAFPLDGGRILRAFLATKMPRTKATNIAAIIGKVLAVVIFSLGIYFVRPMVSLIGIFVFVMADLENTQEKNNAKYKRIKAASICKQNYTKVQLSTLMNELIQIHFDRDENNFIVLDSKGKIVGLVHQLLLEDAMREKGNDRPVSHYLTNRYAIVNINDNLIELYTELLEKDMPLALVMDYGELYGVIDQDMLVEAMELKI